MGAGVGERGEAVVSVSSGGRRRETGGSDGDVALGNLKDREKTASVASFERVGSEVVFRHM